MKKKIAIYPGTFDPFTNGHYDILKRALNLFDELVVLVAVSPTKTPLFEKEERIFMLKKLFENEPRVRIDFHSGLLVDYAKKKDIAFFVRGLRPTGDFDYEFQMAAMNYELYNDLNAVFFMTTKDFHCISSTAVREVYDAGGDITNFVPDAIGKYMQQKRKSLRD